MKSKIFISIVLMWISIPWSTTTAQQARTQIREITDDNTKTNWLHFKKEENITPENLFSAHKKSLGLTEKDEMKLITEFTSPVTGIVQKRFQQVHNGIKVHGAVMNVYLQDGLITKSNGRVIEKMNPVTPVITENAALELALAELPADNYKWNDPAAEQRLKQKRKSLDATYFPKGELIYMYRKGSAKKTIADYELTWKFAINLTRGNSKYIYVSAVTGEIINTLPINITCNPTTITTPMNGPRQIYTSVQGRCETPNSDSYEMWDDCEIDIKVENDGQGTGDDEPICNWGSTNQWSFGTGPLCCYFGDASQVLWGMRTTYEFYHNSYGWYSYNNYGGSVDCTVEFIFEDNDGLPTGNNAQYNEFEEDFDFGFGDDDNDVYDSYTTLDIVAHEYTHGVDDFSADLDYSDESGALDESFADIFGEIVEIFTSPGTDSTEWVHGEDKGSIGRSFINPNDYGDPDTYEGFNWCYYTNSNLDCTDDDFGGVHINSGVQNHFFYLLNEGGQGNNDHGTPYQVSGISTSDAALIAFYAHLYLWGTAEFIDARDAWLEAASDLFGSCSNQAIQVGNAWHAVGVGAQANDYNEMVLGTVTAAVSNTTKEAINQVFTAGTTVINSNSGSYEVRFYAGNEIVLHPGFHAPSGTAFLGRINPCSITIHAVPRIEGAISQINEVIPTTKIEQKIDAFKVFPNPYSNEFTVEFKARDNEIVEKLIILNSIGNVIQEEKLNSPNSDFSATIQTEGLADAIYFIQLITNQRSVMMKTSKMSVK